MLGSASFFKYLACKSLKSKLFMWVKVLILEWRDLDIDKSFLDEMKYEILGRLLNDICYFLANEKGGISVNVEHFMVKWKLKGKNKCWIEILPKKVHFYLTHRHFLFVSCHLRNQFIWTVHQLLKLHVAPVILQKNSSFQQLQATPYPNFQLQKVIFKYLTYNVS